MSEIATVEIVLFEIAGTRYGADMTQVRRIGKASEVESVGRPLGSATKGKRALIFTPDGTREVGLPIDRLLGVHTVPIDDLRRMPIAAPSPFVIGAWIDHDQAILLVDLPATNPFRPETNHA